MYGILLFLHNWSRWLVVVAAVYALYVAYNGWLKRRAFTANDRRAGAIYGAVSGLQLILGLLLYLWPGGLVMGTLTNGGMGAAMKNADTRYFLTQHSVAMLVAILLINFGSTYAKRAADGTGRFKRVAIIDTIATLIIILSIPWWRPLFRV